jgi:hypothetical protein
MLAVILIRMTVLSDSAVYRANALMNANLFSAGCALVAFGLFNVIFLGGFFRTAYNMGKPFIIYIIAVFLVITLFEALHHIPGLEALNAFGLEHIGLQLVLLIAGFTAFAVMTLLSFKSACARFERIDL